MAVTGEYGRHLLKKQMTPYSDYERVRNAMTRLRQAQSDWESFQIVRGFGSNAFRNLLDKAGIDTYGQFLDFNEAKLWDIPGVGKKKIDEFRIARRLFTGGSRSVINPPLIDSEEGRVNLSSELFDVPTASAHIPRAEEPVPELRLRRLGTKGRNLLLELCPGLRVGDVARLTRKRILAYSGYGNKTALDIMSLVMVCRDGLVWTMADVFAMHASEFNSLSDMVVRTIREYAAFNESFLPVMRMTLGLLDATECATLEETGKTMNITRERVRQKRDKILEILKDLPLMTGFSELESWAASFFEIKGMEVPGTELAKAAADQFGWERPTLFSLRRVLETLGFETVLNPKTGLLAWNKDGSYDWVGTYKAPTLAERRRAAIRSVLLEAGREGLTIDEIVAACQRRYPDANIAEGNVRGRIGNGGYVCDDADGSGVRIIGFARGNKGDGGTRYSLNTFFQDEETKSVLQKAGEDVKAYMENTGFGIVDVWKVWEKYKNLLSPEKRLPKLGFYMMMRDVCAGGLSYKDYPRIYYDGMDGCENAYWWELYEYFHYCGHPKASFAQIMSFFVDCLGVQPSIALACTFSSMGLTKDAEAPVAPYEIKRPPVPQNAPTVLLKTVKRDESMSLVKADGKWTIHSDYFDENGHALHHPTYVKVFMRSLEKTGSCFSATELTQLTDAGWCKKNLKISLPLLKKAVETKPVAGNRYWLEKFKFGGELYYVCSDWNQTNKAVFDAWAMAKAKQSGFEFIPYEIGGEDGQ